jgi:hypothetical protein
MKQLASEIYAAVKSGNIGQPFNAAMLKRGVLDGRGRRIPYSLQSTLLATERPQSLFVQVSRGMYRIKR